MVGFPASFLIDQAQVRAELNKLSFGRSGFAGFLADLGKAQTTASLHHRSSMAEVVSIEVAARAG